jgi:hypothetical protein
VILSRGGHLCSIILLWASQSKSGDVGTVGGKIYHR